MGGFTLEDNTEACTRLALDTMFVRHPDDSDLRPKN